MRRISFELVKSGLKMGVLIVALGFQMLPFVLLVVVIAHTLGISGASMLAGVPVLFFAVVFVACWLASRRPRLGSAPLSARLSAAPHARAWQPKSRPGRAAPALLIKTRDERYQDLKDILGRTWR
ncbi:MAG: hypothetical protein O3A85_05805 [Proteobacteria bacterium]|nr:hypothetical protein [Pseudomonadota bacterium]